MNGKRVQDARISRRDVVRLAGGMATGAALLGANGVSAAGSNRADHLVNQVLAQEGTPTGGEFHGWWPYTQPPVGHFNSFVADAITMGIYQGVTEMPLMQYRWDTKEFLPLLATSWEINADNVIVVKLKEGVTWSDGSAFSADDVVTTFTILRMQHHAAWDYLSDVRAVDAQTVEFAMGQPSTVVPYYVLRSYIRAHSVFGDWAARIQEAYSQLGGAGTPVPVDAETAALAPIIQEFNQVKLDHLVVTGPYNFDTSTISSSQLTLTKVPTSFLANTANFDRIVLYNQTDAASIPTLILSGNVDYATSGFPPATEQAMIQAGLRIVRPPTFFGPSIYINYANVTAFNNPKIRGAVAQAIDRKLNGQVSLADSGMPSAYMAGVPDVLLKTWVDEDVLAALNPYPYDVAAATATFEQLGYTKSDDVWTSPDGERMEYEVIVAGENADWATAATNLAEQLTSFGIKTAVRALNGQQWTDDRESGNFQLSIGGWGSGQPHPSFSFRADVINNNSKTDPEHKGISFDLKQTTESVGEVDFEQLIIESAEGLDETAQRATIATLAKAFNELLPIIPLWERLGNDPILVDKRVTGFPDDSDPLYQNSVYSDNFTIQWILDGTLKGVV
jgi:peptide/nickel transport system substrate-binding protein